MVRERELFLSLCIRPAVLSYLGFPHMTLCNLNYFLKALSPNTHWGTAFPLYKTWGRRDTIQSTVKSKEVEATCPEDDNKGNKAEKEENI